MFEEIEDPDIDLVPNLAVQLRRSIDLNGDKPILFQDGSTIKLSVDDMKNFLQKYATLKPIDREEMQKIAIKGVDYFVSELKTSSREKMPKSIYE